MTDTTNTAKNTVQDIQEGKRLFGLLKFSDKNLAGDKSSMLALARPMQARIPGSNQEECERKISLIQAFLEMMGLGIHKGDFQGHGVRVSDQFKSLTLEMSDTTYATAQGALGKSATPDDLQK